MARKESDWAVHRLSDLGLTYFASRVPIFSPVK